MMSEEEKTASPDTILSAVANEQRRAILQTLEDADSGAMKVDELVDRLVERGGREPRDGDHRQRIQTAAYHVHLPKLEACGMVVRDPETGRVRSVTDGLGNELLTTIESYEIHG